MNRRKSSRILLLLSVALFAGAGQVDTQEPQEKPAVLPIDPEVYQEVMRLAQPGPEHELLTQLTGEWVSEVSIQMAPGTPAMVQKATASGALILEGRFVEIKAFGDFMGQPFESLTFLGFDRRHEEYTLIGLDTLGTYWVSARGKRGEDGVIRLRGEDDDTLGKQVFHFEYEFFGRDEYEYRVAFEELAGQVFEEPFTMVTVRNKRKKSEKD